jgi:hypothetical protein
MTSDPGAVEPQSPPPDFSLPGIKSVQRRPAQFRPRRRNFESALPDVDHAIEFLVETDAPIPTRALGPVLHVGDAVLTEVEQDDETHYRFVALRPEQLSPDAAVRLGWSGEPS